MILPLMAVGNQESIEKSSTEALIRIQNLQKSVQQTLHEESDLLNRADFASSRIQHIEMELSQLQTEKKKWQRHLIQTFLLRKSLQNPREDSLRHLFSQPSQLDRMSWFVRRLSENALDQVHQARERALHLADIKEKQINLSRSLEILIQQRNKKQKNLQVQLANQQDLFEKIRAEFGNQPKIFKKIIEDLEKNGLDVQALERQATEAVWKKRGAFSWPLVGAISNPLGISLEPHEFVNLPRKGLFLKADGRPEVRAPFPGKIILIEENPDFGQTIFIDHGDSIWSILAGLKAIKYRTGQVVKKDQVIGIANRSIYNEEEGIYFELRHYGHPLVVREWLSPPTNQTGNRRE